MYKNKLANYETYSKTFDGYDLVSSFTCYEVYVETRKDKDGNVLKNKNGSDRLFPIEDEKIVALANDVTVKQIRDDFYKDIYQVNGDTVEKVDRDGKRIYFVVEPEKIVTLKAGTNVVIRNGTYRIPKDIGYVVIDDTDIDNQRIVAVKTFTTDDHKTEAEKIVKALKPRKKDNQDK